MSWGSAKSFDNDNFFDFIFNETFDSTTDLERLLNKNMKQLEEGLEACKSAEYLTEDYVRKNFAELQLGLVAYARKQGLEVPKAIKDDTRAMIQNLLEGDYLESFKHDDETKAKFQQTLDESEEQYKRGEITEKSIRIRRSNLLPVLNDKFMHERKIALIDELVNL